MATDRQLYEKLGKLLDAAGKEAEGQDEYYRERCYDLISKRFWEIQRKIKTPSNDYSPGYFDTDEEKMKGVYNYYTQRLWLIDAMDEVADDDGDAVEDED